MDTASHLLTGATLGGLAMNQPAVMQHPELAAAIITGTLIGSHAPDFDVLSRLKGFTTYLRHHRGITHSLPALVAWPAVIALPLGWLFGVMEEVSLIYMWTCIAVVIHVGLDLLNSYGVQCLRPFKKKWMHLDMICLFDPFLFTLHSAGLLLWLLTAIQPGPLFVGIYGLSALYLILRAVQHRYNMARVKQHYKSEGIYHVIPTVNPILYQTVLETDTHFYMGQIRYGQVKEEERYERKSEDEIITLTKQIDGVRAFLQFAQRIHVQYIARQDGYEISWSDARFYHNRKMNFGVDVILNERKECVSLKLGYRSRNWVSPM